jgi:SAM-dependent methyltransferase
MTSALRSFAKQIYIKGLNAVLFCNALFYRGSALFCPICEQSFRKMMPFRGSFYVKGELVDHYTPNALCPRCRNDIRHRFILTFLKGKEDRLIPGIRMLHFAPETALSSYLKNRGINYVGCDIDAAAFPGAVKVDVTDIPFGDASFDAVICIHVLEHIIDDEKGIREIYRILKPGGWALIAVPVYGETTLDIKDLTYEGREKMYGTGEHMRMNGLDFTGRLASAGFSVEVVTFEDVPGDYIDRAVRSPHTESDRYLFFCRK